MPQYVIAYFGGDKPSSDEAARAHFARYKAWLAALGDAALSPMNPFKSTTTLKPGGEASNGSVAGMSGYTIIRAENMEAAAQIARDCPFLDIGGVLEVSELAQMPPA